MVTINYLFTKEDYFRYSYYITWRSPGKQKAAIQSRVKNFLILVGCALFIKLISQSSLLDINFLYSVFILASIFIIPLLSTASAHRKQVNNFTFHPLNAKLFGENQATFSDSNITISAKDSSFSCHWQHIVKKEETDEYYYLFISTIQALVIPKRALQSETEKTALETLFAQNISFNAEVGHLVKK